MELLRQFSIDLEISINYIPLIHDNLLGLYSPSEKAIYLDITLLEPKNYYLQRCILSEELGHAVTGTTVNTFKLYRNYSLNRRITIEEESALLWATEKLVPTTEIVQLLENGFYNCEELALFFGVTVWFLFRKLYFLQIECTDKKNIIRPAIKKAKISCF